MRSIFHSKDEIEKQESGIANPQSQPSSYKCAIFRFITTLQVEYEWARFERTG